jgi:uncharacterized protein
MALEADIAVTLVYCPAPRQVLEVAMRLPQGSTLGQALQTDSARDMLAGLPALDLQTLEAGIWGRKAKASWVLRDQDRIEIYRALKVDPKLARRERFVKQGAKKAGLFASKRPGAKAGY